MHQRRIGLLGRLLSSRGITDHQYGLEHGYQGPDADVVVGSGEQVSIAAELDAVAALLALAGRQRMRTRADGVEGRLRTLDGLEEPQKEVTGEPRAGFGLGVGVAAALVAGLDQGGQGYVAHEVLEGEAVPSWKGFFVVVRTDGDRMLGKFFTDRM